MTKQHLQNLLAIADMAVKAGIIPVESYAAVQECVMAGREQWSMMKDHELLTITAQKTGQAEQPGENKAKNVKMPTAKAEK